MDPTCSFAHSIRRYFPKRRATGRPLSANLSEASVDALLAKKRALLPRPRRGSSLLLYKDLWPQSFCTPSFSAMGVERPSWESMDQIGPYSHSHTSRAGSG